MHALSECIMVYFGCTMMSSAERCALCRHPLLEKDFKNDRAMRLFGKPYCTACLEKQAITCKSCRRSLRQKDFDEGRAFTLLGARFCESCLEQAVKDGRKSAPTPEAAASEADWDSHRAHARFIPPAACALTLKRGGIRGLVSGNLLRLWVDVSEGGLRAVVSGNFAVDDVLHGEFSYRPLKATHAFRGSVRHVKPTERYPAAMLIGLRFDAPAPELQAFVRDVLGSGTPSEASSPA